MSNYQAQSGRGLASADQGQPYKVVLTLGGGQHIIRRCARPSGAAARRLPDAG